MSGFKVVKSMKDLDEHYKSQLAAAQAELTSEKERAEGNWSALERIKKKWQADRAEIERLRKRIDGFQEIVRTINPTLDEVRADERKRVAGEIKEYIVTHRPGAYPYSKAVAIDIADAIRRKFIEGNS